MAEERVWALPPGFTLEAAPSPAERKRLEAARAKHETEQRAAFARPNRQCHAVYGPKAAERSRDILENQAVGHVANATATARTAGSTGAV